MGNCAGKRSLITTNDANTTFIYGNDRNHCSLAGVAGDKFHTKFCSLIGDNEWTTTGGYGDYGCNYNDSNNIEKWEGSGCCDAACSIIGRGASCNRQAYRGEPNSCCLRDYACNGINNITPLGNYDSSETDQNGNPLKQRSCPLDNRSLDSVPCQNYIENLCSNLNPGAPNPNWRANWLNTLVVDNPYNTYPSGGHTSGVNRWTSPSNPVCLHALYRNVYGVNNYGCNGVAPPTIATGIQVFPTANGLVFGRQLVQDLFNTYISEGGDLGAGPGDEGDTQMNDLIWGICSTIPGICTTSLEQYCSTITTDDIIRNPNLQKWCGCYMPDFEYSKYTNLYGISKQCTPQCNVAGIIPLVDETGIQTLKCQQSTCVIDNVSIQLYEAKVGTNGGAINFNQVCSSCGSGSNTGTCQCTLTGLNFAAVQATVPSLSISQQCGAGSVCYHESTDSTGVVTTTPIPCSSELGYNPTQTAQELAASAQNSADRWRNTKILLLFIIVITLLIVLWICFAPTNLAEEKRIYARSDPKKSGKITTVPIQKTTQLKSAYIDTDITPINTNYYQNPSSQLTDYNLTPISSQLGFLSQNTEFRAIPDY
jgi:hypothetical protein